MRTLLMALVVVVLATAPGTAAIDVRLVSSKTWMGIGETATISIQARCTSGRAVGQLAGDITYSGYSAFSAGSFQWAPQFTAAIDPVTGSPGYGATWTGFGSQQALPNDPNFGNGVFVEVARYTVTCVSCGYETLTFVPGKYGGFSTKSVFNGSFDSTIGTITGVFITEVPEPATLALLTFGGLLIARRRRC